MANNIIIQFSEIEFKQLLKSCVSEGIQESKLITKQETTDKIFNLKEAAHFLNLAPQTLYGFTSNRTIPFLKKSKKLYFKKAELEIWLNEGKKSTKKEITAGGFAKIKGGKNE